jgi:DNA-binding HxlR family transcriptional regulator
MNEDGSEIETCPVERTLAVIGGRWNPLILFHLRGGKRRFNELRRLMPGVTQRMLTQHLRELEANGVISRTIHPIVPPHVDYSFTALGLTLLPILDAMAAWGDGLHEASPSPTGTGVSQQDLKRPRPRR